VSNDHRPDDHEPGEGQVQGHGVLAEVAGTHLQGDRDPAADTKIATMVQAIQVERLRTVPPCLPWSSASTLRQLVSVAWTRQLTALQCRRKTVRRSL
jgi:hypothetical protein